MPLDAISLLYNMLQFNPENRISSLQAYCHSYFNSSTQNTTTSSSNSTCSSSSNSSCSREGIDGEESKSKRRRQQASGDSSGTSTGDSCAEINLGTCKYYRIMSNNIQYINFLLFFIYVYRWQLGNRALECSRVREIG